ncbi:Rieske 2Fe-2S domain-containing protein [[Limnothrix rosea] IAM M-220]|uniref:aromatic ring-hydroxylating dioxygenase subunit alpha n=1 Tax=[Limnothrix rosea] IAM M-220 TaxID=454133 RepID=UPI00095B3F3F|nr:Rieske 2Fe-2S domain-containing protein [[Limnothrix rosea] IAM M-220]OKH15076.1 cell death suppressor protein Lls1 [[Limnothrix rosea] IAM M-220]
MVANVVSIAPEVSAEKFDWLEAWYPIHFEQDLSKTEPTRFVLLEKPLVIWWHAESQQWKVFADVCPHRLVPLSEGRIVDGCLECPYHGWQFSESGSCEKIPFQKGDGTANESPRAAATTYPCRVEQGLLFVYLGKLENAETQPLPTIPALDQYPGEWVMADVFRDIPYDATTLLENVLDTSHVAFTHHPRVGNRKNAKDFELEVSEVANTGFTGIWEEGPRMGKLGSQKTTFFAPSAMWHDIEDSPFGQVMTCVYAIPTEKGKCRAIVRLPFRFKSVIPRLIFKYTPRWWSHVNQMGILEDDQIFLHLQERELEKSNKNYAQTCYLPTGSDLFVLAYRKWVESFGEPFADQTFAPAEVSQEKLMERYHSHTENCSSCKAALANIKKIRAGLIIVGFLGWLALPFHGVLGLSTTVMGAIAAIISLGGLAWWKLGQYERKFYDGEYPPTRNYKK